MNYRVVPPPPLLQPYVRYFWILEEPYTSAQSRTFYTLVDDSSGLIVQHNNGNSAFVSSKGQPLKTNFIYGQSTRPTTTFSNGAFSLIGVNFHPHGLKSLFGIDAYYLTDQMDELDILGSADLAERLIDSSTPTERIAILTSFLLQRLKEPVQTDSLVCHCLGKIVQSGGQTTVSNLLRECSISERQLERRFRATVGIPPKLYIRIMRFQAALRLMRQKQFNKLSDIAFELEYADQSHFIRDIKEFSGYTPRSLSQEVSELILNLHLGPEC